MVRFIVRRVLYLLLTMLVVSLVVFVVSELAPGNIARNVLGAYTTPAQEASFLRQMGLDRPLYVRYVSWLFGSDWQASRLIGLPVQRLKSAMGYYEWWAVAPDGTLTQWELKGSDLIANRRQTDGTTEKVLDNASWKTDANGHREFWGVDNRNRAVKWEIGRATTPTGGLDLHLQDGLLGDTSLLDTQGLSVQLNAGAKSPGTLPVDAWIYRDLDLGPLAGDRISAMHIGVD